MKKYIAIMSFLIGFTSYAHADGSGYQELKQDIQTTQFMSSYEKLNNDIELSMTALKVAIEAHKRGESVLTHYMSIIEPLEPSKLYPIHNKPKFEIKTKVLNFVALNQLYDSAFIAAFESYFTHLRFINDKYTSKGLDLPELESNFNDALYGYLTSEFFPKDVLKTKTIDVLLRYEKNTAITSKKENIDKLIKFKESFIKSANIISEHSAFN